MSDDDFSNIVYQDDFNKEEKPFMPENFVKAGVPFLTNYIGLFGKSPFWFVENDRTPGIHFNHIKLSLPHIILHLLLLSSIFIFKFEVYDYYFDEYNSYFYFIFVLYIMLTISMIRTIFTNPGYLPFFYPAQNDRKEFTQEEYRLGYACQQEQYNWAKKQPRPNRSCFSERVGYYVIRPDHYCGWVTNWIGYRNHRFFLIFISCSAVYLDILFLNCCHMYWYHRNIHSFLCFAFMIGFSCSFGVFFSIHTVLQSLYISMNITLVEIFKGQFPFYNRGCLNNWSEICGSKKLICLWPFPCIYLKPGINVFNYPEYVGPSYKDDVQIVEKDEVLKDKNEKPFNNALGFL